MFKEKNWRRGEILIDRGDAFFVDSKIVSEQKWVLGK